MKLLNKLLALRKNGLLWKNIEIIAFWPMMAFCLLTALTQIILFILILAK